MLCWLGPAKAKRVNNHTCIYTTQMMLVYIGMSLFIETYFLEDSPEVFHYLSQSGCVKDRSLDDKQHFDDVMV